MALTVKAESKIKTCRLTECGGEWAVQGYSKEHDACVTLHECGGLEAKGKTYFAAYKGM